MQITTLICRPLPPPPLFFARDAHVFGASVTGVVRWLAKTAQITDFAFSPWRRCGRSLAGIVPALPLWSHSSLEFVLPELAPYLASADCAAREHVTCPALACSPHNRNAGRAKVRRRRGFNWSARRCRPCLRDAAAFQLRLSTAFPSSAHAAEKRTSGGVSGAALL